MDKGAHKINFWHGFIIKNKPYLIIGLILLLGILWWLFFHFIYENPSQVFNAMLNNSLSTTGVIETLHEVNGDETINQRALVQLGGLNRVEIYKTDKVSVGNSIINNTLIGTPSTDYTEFDSISGSQRDSTGQIVNYSSVIGKWTVNKSSSPTGGQLLKVSVLNPILIGNLNAAQKHNILSYIKNYDIYEINNINKVVTNHKLTYIYNVKLALQPYSVVLNKFGIDLGYSNTGTSGSQSLIGQTLNLKITVNAISRQLVSIAYVNSDININFSAFGIISKINIPDHTITVDKIESMINAALNK